MSKVLLLKRTHLIEVSCNQKCYECQFPENECHSIKEITVDSLDTSCIIRAINKLYKTTCNIESNFEEAKNNTWMLENKFTFKIIY